MKRNATLNLKGLDPDVVDAARDVARRAGMPLETWIASVVEPPQDKAPARRKRRQAEPVPRSDAARPDAKTAPARVEPAPAPMPGDHAVAASAGSPVDPFAASIAQMLDRLDAIDAKVNETRKAAQGAASHAAAEADSNPTIGQGGAAPDGGLGERLATIERRMTELAEQLAQPRPLGRRGRPAAAEIADAVGEIRQRQRELEAQEAAPPGARSAVAALQRDVATGMAASFQQAPSSTITELQAETSRLRESIGGLATGQEVNALEQAMLGLASGVRQVEKPADLAAIVEPIERIQAQISRLADDVAENVHARVAGDVERLALKFDRALTIGAAGSVDRDALSGLFGELDEIRRLIGALAGPDRIQSLAQGLQALSGQIAQLQGDAAKDASRMAELRPLLEEIRTDLKTPKTIAHRDEPGESQSRPAMPGGDLATIHAMLHDLADKVDRVGAGGPGDGLDALERQIMALSARIETRSNDPAIAGLERAMNDLLTQVAPQGDQAAAGEIVSLRAGLAELRSQQAASEQRMQATLNGVHAALDRLTTQFDSASAVTAPPIQVRAPSASGPDAGRLPTSGMRRPDMPRAPAARPDSPAEVSRVKDEILEPGAGRPGRPRPGAASEEAESEAAGPSSSEIKSNFIAAARRAALAAQAEAAEASPKAPARDAATPRRTLFGEASAPAAEGAPTRAAQMRARLDKRRKHLLLGLAAVILALGTFQAIRMFSPADEPAPDARAVAGLPEQVKGPGIEADPSAAKANPATASAATGDTTKPDTAKPPSEPARPDPQTTQSIAPASDAGASPPAAPGPDGAKSAPPAAPAGRKSAPRVADMSSVAADLAGLSPTLAPLKKAALEGDGAAIYDLASRSAEGRGLTRDLALAAKLYEKLASAGYAPAQYKLAGQYEKGLGLARDLAQAKLWYGRAAEAGNVRSMHNLAVIFAENPSATGKPDFASAAQWFRRGAEYGVRDSQYNLAVLSARGLGVPQDLVQSFVWFSAAAAQGDEDAGKKRDDVAAKLASKDLATARSLAAAFKAKPAEPTVNEPPPAAASATMTLLGAPAPAPAPPAPRRG